MRAVACNTTVEPDELTLEFEHAFVVDAVCYAFTFRLSMNIGGFKAAAEVSVSNDVFAAFVRQLTALDETLTGRAYLDSADCLSDDPEHFAFAIEPYGTRGHLAVRVRLALSELNSFSGGLIVEPARLADWRREFSEILARKEPAIDFYGNWKTRLPLPQRLRNLPNYDVWLAANEARAVTAVPDVGLSENPAMQVRRADSSDIQLLARLNQQLIRDEGHRNSMSVAELETRMTGWLDGDYEAHVFAVDGQTIGYVLARGKADYVYLRQFFILPDFRRRGLGRAAFQWMLANVWNDCQRLRLEVLIGNRIGIEFWHSLGFNDYCLAMEREFPSPPDRTDAT